MTSRKMLALTYGICLITILVALPFISAAASKEAAATLEAATPATTAQGKEAKYTVLNPRGMPPEVQLTPLSPRLTTLSGKTIYVISLLRHEVQIKVAELLPKYAPGVRVVFKEKPNGWMADEPELWNEIKQKGDAMIFGTAWGRGGNMFSAKWTIEMEKRGVPSVNIHPEPFIEDIKATSEKLGMPALRTVVVPTAEISDQEYSKIVMKIVDALTKPLNEVEKRTGKTVPPTPPRIALTGTLDEIEDYFYTHHWTDGLPIVPPTEARVEEFLKHTKHAPHEVVTTTMFPEEWKVTVENVAIVGVMAGCKPQYMPVLLAIVEAWGKGAFPSSVRSVNSFSFPVVVNGPIRNEIGMNSEVNAMGSSTDNIANATIGRFLRLAIINLGGSINGVNDLGTQGGPARYTFAFAENEEKSPWEPFHVSMGFKPGDSVVTIFNGGWSHIGNSSELDKIAKGIATFEWPNGCTVILDPLVAKEYASKGMSKQAVEQYIWEHATLSMKEFKTDHYYKSLIEPNLKGRDYYGEKSLWPSSYLGLPDDAVVQVYPRKYVKVLVVGGETSALAQAWKFGNHPSMISVDKWR